MVKLDKQSRRHILRTFRSLMSADIEGPYWQFLDVLRALHFPQNPHETMPFHPCCGLLAVKLRVVSLIANYFVHFTPIVPCLKYWVSSSSPPVIPSLRMLNHPFSRGCSENLLLPRKNRCRRSCQFSIVVRALLRKHENRTEVTFGRYFVQLADRSLTGYERRYVD